MVGHTGDIEATIVPCKAADEAIKQNRSLNSENAANFLQKCNMKNETIQKVLDTLADSGRILFKEYGKQKIYRARQDQFDIPNTEELNPITEENATLEEKLHAQKKAISEVESAISLLAILKHEPKYQNPPQSEGLVNLEDDDTPAPESGPSSSLGQSEYYQKKHHKIWSVQKKKGRIYGLCKARDAQHAIDRAKELALAEAAEQRVEADRKYAEDMRTMQVNPNIFTPNKKNIWEMKQKVIMDREMVDACLTPPPITNSSTARNLYPSPNETHWIDYDLNYP